MSTDATKPAPAVANAALGDNVDAAADHLLTLLGDDEPENPDGAGPQSDSSAGTGEPTDANADESPDGASDDAGQDDKTDADETTPGEQEEPRYSVKVDGAEVEVPLSELLAGYSRQADYTRKTSALAEQRRAFEAERKAKTDEYAQEVGRLAQFAQMIVSADPVLAEAQKIDWGKLANDDPIEWARKKGAVESRLATLQAVQNEVARVQTERAKEHLQAEMEAAQRAIPDLADPEKGKALKNDFRQYLGDRGFSTQEIASIGDHRILLVVNDALAYRRMVKEQEAAKQKVAAAATKALKPNTAERNKRENAKLDAKQRRALSSAPLDRVADALASLL